jgi:cytochrome c oxidase cbb3-type subunit 3
MKRFFSALMLLLLPALLFAREAPKRSVFDNPMAIVLVTIIIVLLLVIALLGYVLTGAAQFHMKRVEEEKKNPLLTKLFLLAVCCTAGFSASAQEATDAAAVVKDDTIAGLSGTTFYLLASVIGLELIVIFSMAFFLKRLLAKEKPIEVAEPVEEKESSWKKLWERMNQFRSLKEEAAIELDHNYDGIRELDNKLPPWWLYGFYLTILFAVIYLWRFEVAHTAPSSEEEYTTSVKNAEIEKEAYLAKSASKVDENSIKMLDESGVAAGKTLFTATCAACHAADGGGTVGPNLTDDYWLHGGSLKDIFKTIKYGVPEKGMKSWKDDFSPVQVAQLTSFIKSIKGNKVAVAKEPQGDVYKEAEAAADSATQKVAVINQ